MRIHVGANVGRVIRVILAGIALVAVATNSGSAAAALVGTLGASITVGKAAVPVRVATFIESPPSPEPAPPDLSGEHFVSATIGYGVTSDGQILMTRNAGRTWTRVAMDPSASFGTLSWTGNVGVADGLFFDGGMSANVSTLAVTTDDGTTWSFLHPTVAKPLRSSLTYAPTVVKVISEKDMILLPPAAVQYAYTDSSLLPVSTDSGRTFHPVPLPKNWEPTGGFAVESLRTVLLTMMNVRTGESGVAQFSVQDGFTRIIAARLPVELYAALKSPNGALYVAGGTFAKFDPPVAEAFYKVNFSGPGHIALVSEIQSRMRMAYSPIVQLESPTNATFYALEGGIVMGANGPDSGTLLVSHDSGLSWTTTHFVGSKMSVVGSHIWLLAGQNTWNSQLNHPTDLLSDDWGLHFRNLPVQTGKEWALCAQFGPSKTRTGIPRLYVQTTKRILQSQNGGQSWTKFTLPMSADGGSYDYVNLQSAPSFRILNSMLRVSLDVSFDHGLSWRKVPMTKGVDVLDGVTGTPGGSIILIGHSALSWDNVYITHDGGKSWTTVSSPFGQMDGMSVTFVSNEIGYAAPQLSDSNPSRPYPYLWLTTNVGETWHKIGLSSWNWIPGPWQSPTTLVSVGRTLIFAGVVNPSDFRATSVAPRALIVFYPLRGDGA